MQLKVKYENNSPIQRFALLHLQLNGRVGTTHLVEILGAPGTDIAKIGTEISVAVNSLDREGVCGGWPHERPIHSLGLFSDEAVVLVLGVVGVGGVVGGLPLGFSLLLPQLGCTSSGNEGSGR